MEIYFHDDSRLYDDHMESHAYDPVVFAPKHGHRGITHAATAQADYAYQVEQWVIDAGKDMPSIVRIECPELGREWKRVGDKFVEK